MDADADVQRRVRLRTVARSCLWQPGSRQWRPTESGGFDATGSCLEAGAARRPRARTRRCATCAEASSGTFAASRVRRRYVRRKGGGQSRPSAAYHAARRRTEDLRISARRTVSAATTEWRSTGFVGGKKALAARLPRRMNDSTPRTRTPTSQLAIAFDVRCSRCCSVFFRGRSEPDAGGAPPRRALAVRGRAGRRPCYGRRWVRWARAAISTLHRRRPLGRVRPRREPAAGIAAAAAARARASRERRRRSAAIRSATMSAAVPSRASQGEPPRSRGARRIR